MATATAYTPTMTAYGTKPGAVPFANPAADLAAQYPNLAATNQKVSSNIMSDLSGQLSPDVLNQIQDATASWGVQNGMPGMVGGSIGANRGLRDVGLTSMALQKQGNAEYNATVPTVSQTQTLSPELQTQINDRNSVYAAAPDPQAAANAAQALFDQYLNKMGGAGGSGSATSSKPGNYFVTGGPFGFNA